MSRIIKLIIPIFVIGIIFNTSSFVFGQNEDQINDELKTINNEIKIQKDKIKEIDEKKELYTKTIKSKQNEKANLNNQLAILENRLAKAELDKESVELEINRLNLEIKKVNIEINENNNKINQGKEHIANILKIIYKQDQVSSLEILLLNDSLTDFLNEMKYLEDTNEEMSKSLDSLGVNKKELEKNKLTLDKKNKEALNLKEELEEKEVLLDNEKGNKEFILTQVNNSEKQYQNLLAKAKEEQAQAAADITSLEKTVRAKITELSGKKLEFNDSGLIWPVLKNVITSLFHDPEYPFRYIFEHPAIDIRSPQGSTIKAAASGYVARAKDAGKGYSYIMIVHGDGLSTVYGHASKIYVKEDEYVVQGQAIGASGGMPGTPGAGNLTTGPHLHFEVRLNGIPVNPFEYLP
ncbi:MAG: peptidoglycan DD-metalloendopeptidase family protein [Patescibacteria group bacterium]